MPEIYTPPGSDPVFPASVQTLQELFPQTIFPQFMTAEEKVEFYLFQVELQPQPQHDSRLQICTQLPPAFVDGRWVAGWDLRPATPAEIAEWDDLNPPEPEWLAFSDELGMMPQIVNLLRIVFQVNPAFFSQLTIGLSDAAKGDSRLFLGAWSQAIQNQLVNQELIDIVANLAIKYHLPTSFVDGLKNIS
jgi:hypothetical protein